MGDQRSDPRGNNPFRVGGIGRSVWTAPTGPIPTPTDAWSVARSTVGVTETNDPGFRSFAWPLHVGRSWVQTFTFRDHAEGRSFENEQFWSAVEAYEDVTVPAGTFKAFRIVHDNQSVRFMNWWEPGSLVRCEVQERAEEQLPRRSGSPRDRTDLL
jgi:hypothetical protein